MLSAHLRHDVRLLQDPRCFNIRKVTLVNALSGDLLAQQVKSSLLCTARTAFSRSGKQSFIVQCLPSICRVARELIFRMLYHGIFPKSMSCVTVCVVSGGNFQSLCDIHYIVLWKVCCLYRFHTASELCTIIQALVD